MIRNELKYWLLFLTISMTVLLGCQQGPSYHQAKNIVLKYSSNSGYVSDANKYSFKKLNYTGDSVNLDIFNTDVQLVATGGHALTIAGDTSNLKIGEWIEYYPNQIKQSKGSYGIYKYIQCCFAGPCMQYYNYKLGYWEYYHPDGSIQSRGTYHLLPKEIPTSCGEALILEAEATDEWEYFTPEGHQIAPPKD
jgi:hypothetical protein